jgi:4-amino-4-deoxy-L-arabinose transferase-like glycosyltransferase
MVKYRTGGLLTVGTIRTAWVGAVQRFPRVSSVLPMVVALVIFGLPLFVGLDNWELENDEAIYSYSVDRILETGEWLTPRSIMVDGPFLEKPPLKTWIVAAGIASGLPHDERGLRFWDALFGVAAFAYVFVIGRRLAGLLCGFTALLVLHTCWPLVFEHGLRTNNMEAALVLTYSGGVYHFFRWTEVVTRRQRRAHAWMVAIFFAFGFLTKFVAALFLPVVLATAFLWQRDVRSRLRTAWPDWVLPAAGAVVLIAPWFVYQSVVHGRYFWNTILGVHVFQRFTAFLDPVHLKPWYFYFTRTFASAGRPAFPLLISIVGLALLARRAWQGHAWLARLVLVWWIVPYVLLSVGTSKLVHYAYPFFPPIALAAGLAIATWVDVMGAWIRGIPAVRPASTMRPAWRHVLLVFACISLALGLWSALTGSVTISVFGVQLFRSSGLARPALIGVLLLALARQKRAALWVVTPLVVLAAAPVSDYFFVRAQLASINRPLRTLRDCIVHTVGIGHGVYAPDPTAILNPHFYYLRTLGPWAEGPANREQELVPRLFTPGRRTPVLMAKRDIVPPIMAATFLGAAGTAPPKPVGRRSVTLKGIETTGDVIVWLPGSYGACAAPAAAASGKAAVVRRTSSPIVPDSP